MRYPRVSCCALRLLFLASLIVSWSATVLATPPVNDVCQGAIIVPASGPFPYLSPLTTNINEATSAGDPAPPSGGDCGGAPLKSGGIWYVFSPTVSATYHLSVSDDTGTTVVDTLMAVYRGTDCSSQLTVEDCNDDQGSLTSALALPLTAGRTYYILVWAAYATPTPSTATVQLRVSQPTVPANDTCAGAEVIPGSGPFPYLTQISDTTLATSSGDPSQTSCSTNHFAGSVWYRFTPTATRMYVASTCDDSKTTVYDTLIGIYTNACGAPFNQVACSDIFDGRAVVTNAFIAGTTYYIVAGDATTDGVIPGQTLIQLRIFEPRGPEVKIASSITPTSAVLNGTIPDFNTALTKAWFEWGTNGNYNNMTPVQFLKTGTNDVNFSAVISGLTTNAYSYRLAISNCFGLARSPNQMFMFSNVRPLLSASLSGGGFRLQFTGNPGQQYTVLSSTSFSGWQEIGAPTNAGNGQFEYRVPAVDRSRFFQIRSP